MTSKKYILAFTKFAAFVYFLNAHTHIPEFSSL
jgi:hypothetical protein